MQTVKLALVTTCIRPLSTEDHFDVWLYHAPLREPERGKGRGRERAGETISVHLFLAHTWSLNPNANPPPPPCV